MGLQIWLSLNGNLDNQGLSEINFSSNYSPSYADGKIGKCMNGETTISFSPSSTITTAGISISMWVKSKEVSSSSTVWWKIAAIRYTNNTSHNIYTADSGNGRYKLEYSPSLNIYCNTQIWHHIVFTLEGSVLSGYLDGIKIGSSNEANDIRTVKSIDVGGNSNVWICDFRVYDTCISPYEIKQISQGLVLHYPLSSISEAQKLNNDTTVYDCSGFSNNGAINGTINWSDDTPRYSGSYIPATASSYISTTLNTSGYANSYTFSYWAKISDMSGKMVWGFGNGNRLNAYPTGSAFCWNTGDGGNNPFKNNGMNVSFSSYNGSWHHYAITGDGTTTTLYIDGEKKGISSTYKSITGTQLYISGWDTGTSYKWTNGNISDFRIYATCLSDEDIKELYQVSASVDKSGILSCYEFSDDGNNKITKNGVISFSDLYESDDISSAGIGKDIIQANKFIEL